MAKIVCEFDTDSKTMTVTQDGKKIKDANSFSVYQKMDYVDDQFQMTDEWTCQVMSCSENEDTGISVMTQMSANEGGELKIIENSPAKSLAKTIASTRK